MDPITAFFVNLIIGVILSVGSTLASQAFNRRGNDNKVSGYRGSIQSGGRVPLSFLVGTIGVAGKLEYRNTWGQAGNTPNAYLVDVISFGDVPVSGLAGLFVNSQQVTVPATGHATQGYPVPEYTSGGAAHLWREFFDGSQTAANTYLTGKFGSDPDRPWSTDMIGRGVPYLTLTALIAEDLWTGFPTYLAVLQGIKLYDPRLDTAAGGSGSQRWADPTTWAFSDNNIVIIYNILRGIHDNSATVTTLGPLLWGGDARANQLPYAEWAAAMNACDELVTLAAGGTEKRFRAGREVFVNERPADVIIELLIGANARLSPAANGQFHILVGVPAAADGSFTDADVIVTEVTTLDAFPNLDQIVNGATATYLEPAQAWEAKETSPYYRSDLEAEDDNRRQLEGLTLETTFSGTQAQRILKAVVEESRRFVRHVVVLPPGFGVYHVLQVLNWTSDANGYTGDGKLFLITSKSELPNANVILGLQEIDPADHDWVPGTDERPITFAPLTPIRPQPQELEGFEASPYTFLGDAGEPRRPGILVEWPGGLVDVRAIQIQVFEDFGTHDCVFDREVTYEKLEANPQRAIGGHWTLPDTHYHVWGKLIPFDGSGRSTIVAGPIGVTTPNVLLGPSDFYGLDINALNADLEDTITRTARSVRDVREGLQRINLLVQGLADSANAARTRMQQELRVALGENTAQWTLAVEVVASATQVLGVRTEAIELQLVDQATGLSALLAITDTLGGSITALDGTLTALGVSLTDLAGEVHDPSTGLGATFDAVNALSAVVATNGTSLTAALADIAALHLVIEDPTTGLDATFDAVSGLTTDVSSINGDVTAALAAILALEGVVGYDSGSATLRLDATYTPEAGWDSGFALQARRSAGDGWTSVGLYGEVNATGGRIILDGDQVVIRAGGSVAALFQAGTTVIADARIGVLDATHIAAHTITADEIEVKSLDADEVLVDGTLITDLIAGNAVNGWAGSKGSTGTSVGSVADEILHTYVHTPNGGSVLVVSTFMARVTGTGTETVNFRLKRNGVTVDWLPMILDDIPSSTVALSYIDPSPGTSAVTWTVVMTPASGSETKEWSAVPIYVLNGKR